TYPVTPGGDAYEPAPRREHSIFADTVQSAIALMATQPSASMSCSATTFSMGTLRSIEVGARSRKSSAGWTASQPTITDDNRQQRIYRTWRGWVRPFYGTTTRRSVSGAPGPCLAELGAGQAGRCHLQPHRPRSRRPR